MTSDEAYAELVTLTGLSAQEWADILSLPKAGQRIAIDAYRDADWKKSPDTLAAVLDVLGIIGTIAGTVSGVAGAATAIQALKSL